MLRCGYCETICDNYEDWLFHLVSEEHQANLGMNDALVVHTKDHDRNERSLIMFKMNPKTDPFEVACHFATIEPLGFVTDIYVHIFPHVNEKFYLIVFDQRKFAFRIASLHEKCGDQKVISSMVSCRSKSSLTETEWNSKLQHSFFYRRHENLRRKLAQMGWDQQLEALVKYISLDQKGYEQRESVIEELETLIREEFHEATVNPFGSCTTWLADVNADLDVYVDTIGDRGRNEMDSEKKEEIMNNITKILRKKYDGHNVYFVRNARVPIIKISHPTGLKVDISFENCLPVQNSKMIRLMTKLDYRVRRFLIFLRYWARFHNLIGPHAVKSYALIMMAFVYLRREKILPSVYELQHIEGVNEFTVCNWNASYCGNRDATYKHLPWLKASREPPSDEGTGHEVLKLAYGFFKEYSTLDFETQVVCPFTGTFLPKAAFESTYGKDLPAEMELLKANLVTNQCKPFLADKPLCIQDPFALNVNVTASCGNMDTVTQLKAACVIGLEALKPFITTYGLAGTEIFLELCCQPVTEEKKLEVILAGSAIKKDDLACVVSEATSSTHEDDIWETSDSTTAAAIAQAVSNVSGHSRHRDQYPNRDRRQNFDQDHDSYDSRRCDRDRNRDRDDGRPFRIPRTSMHEDNEWETQRKTDGYDYDPDKHSRFYDKPSSPGLSRYSKDKEHEGSGKAIKSSVVVASKLNFKTEVTSSSSPKRSLSSSSSTKKSHDEKSQSTGEPEASGSPREIVNTDKELNEDTFTNASSRKLKTKDDETTNSKGKSYKEIVVVLENKSVKREVMDFQSASISSAPVLYNNSQTVKFVATGNKVEPVVKFVPIPVNKPMQTPPPPPPPPPPTQKIIVDYLDNAEDEEDEYEEDDDQEVDELEEVDKFLNSLHQIEPPEKSNVCFDGGVGAASSSYGYERAVLSQKFTTKQQTQAHYVPPQARSGVGQSVQPQNQRQNTGRAAIETLSRPILCFPAFSLFMNDTFQHKYADILACINVPDAIKSLKMKVLWINAVSDFFSDNNFWVKFAPLYPESSLEIHKVNETSLVFQMATNRQADLLDKDSHCYTLINSSRRRKRGFDNTSSDGLDAIRGPNSKMLKTDSNLLAENDPWEYQRRAEIMQKLAKVPSNARKPFAIAYYFACRPEFMNMAHDYWQKVSATLVVGPSQSPLDVFGKMCTSIRESSSLPPVPTKAEEPILAIRLLVAFDTTGEIPGVYFGFESFLPQNHPHWPIQETFNKQFESVLKNLLHAYTCHRLQKYFKPSYQ